MAVEFDIARSGFSLRPATDTDVQACRMLLPTIGGGAIWIVAVDGRHNLVVGAAAMLPRMRRKPPAGPGMAIHVIEPCRQAGVGGSLLDELSAAAATSGAQALYAAHRVEIGSAAMRAWQWMGFVPAESVQEHMLPVDQFEPQLAPLLDRLQHRIPHNAQVIPLYQADAVAVARLHMAELGGDSEVLRRRILGESADAFSPRLSRVLLIGDRVMGCILARRLSKELVFVDANIVDPAIRGRWANIWLKLASTQNAMQSGVKRFRFNTFDHYGDTRSFTERLGGVTTRTTVLMHRLLK